MIIKAPDRQYILEEYPSVFLAGSIEMGAAEDWQVTVGNELSEAGFYVFNPRRDDWDSSWEQSINNPQFFEQVKWELDHLDEADCILLYLSPGTKSPISLLELGLHAADNKLVVCCPTGFWRKGNVEIVCERYKIPVYTTLESSVNLIKYRWGV